ncbi:hypothetical protein MYX82_03750 [Acidobacteria bacterium AH-259-D05]|nr:hypothetical protein [Acidobacteria bacterium AH-259-D05]
MKIEELDARLDRLEKITDRLEFLLPTAEKIALHLNAQTDDAMELIATLEEINRGGAMLLNGFSRSLMEKSIHEELDKWEQEQERSSKVNAGVPKKILRKN